MSRVVIPLAYRAMIFSSNPGTRRWCLGISTGSKVPSRSRGVAIVSSPRSPCTVLGDLPLRRFGERFRVPAAAPEGAYDGDSLDANSSGASSVMAVCGDARRPKCTSISVLSIRSNADFIINRIKPLRSSAVLAWLANSVASCSARNCKEASMRLSPFQKRALIATRFC
jgi:hypothetical protein